MRKQFIYFIAVLFLLFCTFAYAGTVKEYSAEMVVAGNDGTSVEKIFASGNKIRLETKDKDGNRISIVRLDKGKVYILSPSNKNYVEIELQNDGNYLESIAKGVLQGMGTVDIKREKKGAETMNGYKTTKYEITTNIVVMGIKKTVKTIEWVAPEYDPLPIRSVSVEENVIIEMRNVKKGPQKADLFEIPAGYKKAPSMLGMTEWLMPE